VSEHSERATLGGGCFWCLEAVFLRIEGVHTVASGYAGGHHPAPTYREVCRGTTGHAEVVRVAFDPRVLPYEELLRIFFTIHDPTTPGRQGGDVGPQYRSIILTESEEQERIARAVMAEVSDAGLWDAPLVTELAPLEKFFPAEAEHHEYYDRNPEAGYCRLVIEPKVSKARATFSHRFRD
jgi:peptide-methionine (S)-S-oxide reductase